MLKQIAIKPLAKHTSTLIFLHGLGDSGAGWTDIATMLAPAMPNLKFIFPTADIMPVTCNGGMRMNSWYDIYSMDRINAKQDKEGMMKSLKALTEIIDKELDLGMVILWPTVFINNPLVINDKREMREVLALIVTILILHVKLTITGIPNSRIIVGGFSQGAAMSLLNLLNSPLKLGGVIALSGYIPLHEEIDSFIKTANANTPILCGHGTADAVVAYSLGDDSVKELRKRGYSVDFKTYDGMGHSACDEEFRDLATFLKRVLG